MFNSSGDPHHLTLLEFILMETLFSLKGIKGHSNKTFCIHHLSVHQTSYLLHVQEAHPCFTPFHGIFISKDSGDKLTFSNILLYARKFYWVFQS